MAKQKIEGGSETGTQYARTYPQLNKTDIAGNFGKKEFPGGGFDKLNDSQKAIINLIEFNSPGLIAGITEENISFDLGNKGIISIGFGNFPNPSEYENLISFIGIGEEEVSIDFMKLFDTSYENYLNHLDLLLKEKDL